MKKKIIVFCILFLLVGVTSGLVAGSGLAYISGNQQLAEKSNEEKDPALSINDTITIEVGEEYSFADKFLVDESLRDKMSFSVEDDSVIYVTQTKFKVIGLKAGQSKLFVSSSDCYSEVNFIVAEKNLYEDGNFESMTVGTVWDTSNQLIDNWRLYTGGAAVKADQVISVEEENGNKVMHYQHSSVATSTLYTTVQVPAGYYYAVVDMKGIDVAKDTYVRVNQGGEYGLTQTQKVKGTFDWNTYSSEIVQVAEGKTLKLELYFAANSGEVFFDNLRVYRVIPNSFTSFSVKNSVEKLKVGDTAQIECSTNPTSLIDYDYTYEAEDLTVAKVSKTGLITALKNGYTTIKITDLKYNYTRNVQVLIGDENTISASVNSGDPVTVKEDSQNEIKVDVIGTTSYTVYKYSQAKYGKYYIDENNTIVYNPNVNYYTSAGTYDNFRVVVFDVALGYTIVEVSVIIEAIDDNCSVVDYWHTTPKNTRLEWIPTIVEDRRHTSGNVASNGYGDVMDGGYLQVSCYDIEAIIPATKKASMTTAERTEKRNMYSKIVGTAVDKTFTIQTTNGGRVEILNDGVVQEIQDRYYESTGKIIYGVLYNYTPKAGFTGYDTFDMVIKNGEEEITFTSTVYVLPDVEDFKFDTLDFDGVYLLSNDEWLEEVRQGLANGDEVITTWVEYYEKNYAIFNPEGSPAAARTPLEQLAILYQITGKEKYFDYCWSQMREIVKDENFSEDGTRRLDWGEDSNGFLDAAMVTYSVGFAYNYIKDKLTQEQKTMVIKALYEEGFYYFETLSNVNVLLHGNNHNLLVCGDLALAALSAMSYSGEIEVTVRGETSTINVQEMASRTVMTAFKYLQVGLVHYSESGGFPEGPSYSYYAHRNMIYLLATLRNLYGEVDGKIYSFGLSDIEGIMNYTNYPLYSSSPNYDSFFYAESEYSNNQPGLLWYTRIDDKNKNAAVLSKLAHENEQYNILNLLWYKPGLFLELDIHSMEQLDYLLEDHELATFREAFGNEYAVFAGLKGVDTQSGAFAHKNLDSGTFEFYALGEKFIGNYSNETYNDVVPDGFWDYDYQRWTYYKKNAQGQNTLVINPETNQVITQDPYENAPIIRFESNSTSGLAIVDLSGVYKSDAFSVQRGLKMYDKRTKVMIQDEFSLRDYSTLYWSAHTEARIDLISDKIARLTLNGKSVYAYIASEMGTFSKMSATTLPGTNLGFCNLTNDGVNKLLIKLDNILEGTLSVVFTPSLEEITAFEQNVTPLNNWSLDADVKISDAHLDSVEINSELGDKYRFIFNPYQYQYVVKLDSNTKAIPNLTYTYDTAKYSAEFIKGKSFSDLSKIVVKEIGTEKTRTYSFKYIVDTIIDESVISSYDVIEVANIVGGTGIENVLDNNKSTTFTSEKKETVILELKEESTISNILIRFSGGLLNTYYFDIYYSLDNENYECCYFSGQSTNGMGDEVYTLGAIKAKYIKIVFNGNNNNDKVTVSKINLLFNHYVPETNNNNMIIIICSVVGGLALIGAAVTITIITLKRRKKNEEKDSSSEPTGC